MTNDPRATLALSPMRRPQTFVVALCIMLNALDGFDVLSVSFASPGIAADWGITRAALGFVLSMELIGMAVGSVWLGNLCDRIGRRPTVLICLTIMAMGMALATTATNVRILSVYRLLTGLGIGGMLAATNAVVAEYASDRSRNLSVALMAGGYPIGAVLGGMLASWLLIDGTWRSVFEIGAIASAVCIPLVWLLMPETVPWLIQKRPTRALERTNAVLARLGHEPVNRLPEVTTAEHMSGTKQLFANGLAPVTLLLTLAYLSHILTFYFILKWAPKIVADMGYAASSAGGVLVWANIGGVTGSLLLSLLTQRFGVRGLTIGAMLLSTVLVAAFGAAGTDLSRLSISAATASLVTNAAVVGLYAIFAQSFPTEFRAGGTGFVIGVGRGGAALSPILAGFLFTSGVKLPTVALLLGLGSAVAALALILLGRHLGGQPART